MSSPTELIEYVNSPDSSFAWRLQGIPHTVSPGVKRIDIALTSQTWRQTVWRHSLTLFLPDEASVSDTVLLTIGADGPCSHAHEALALIYIARTGLACAFLFDVPNQPLFEGRIEDALIAYTLIQRLDTGEADWPLLLPMTRSAAAAMSAITAVAISQSAGPLARFVVTGASKRGWTTWLTAATDKRVVGIAPVVYDNLNLFAQLPHQVDVFDNQYSEQISDYTEAGLMQRMATPEGYLLTRLIDPYSYLDRIDAPILIINGSNDPYWATDALCLYWNDLKSPANVLYVPNQPHHLNDPDRINPALAEFAFRCAQASLLPKLEMEQELLQQPRASAVSLQSTVPVVSGACWWAASVSRDFRLSAWNRKALSCNSGCSGVVEHDDGGFVALFGEAVFEGETGRFPLSTPVVVTQA